MYVILIIIVIALIVIVCIYNSIMNAVNKSTAKRRLKMYPNAVKEVFGYHYQVSLEKESDVNCFVAPAHTEKFWKDKEKEGKQRLERCNKLKAANPNGWESWKELHPKQYEDLRIVDKAETEISLLEKKFSKYLCLNSWISQQQAITTKATNFGGYTAICYIDGIDKFGNTVDVEYPVAHLYREGQEFKASEVRMTQKQSPNIDVLVNVAKKISEEVVFLTLPDFDDYQSTLQKYGVQSFPISEICDYSWKDKQVFAILTTIVDKQEIAHITNVLLSNINTCPLLIAFSIVNVPSDTEYNIRYFKEYSANHNNENSYSADKLLEIHPFEEAYYFIVKGQTLHTVKKVISSYFNKFDTDAVAERTSLKYRYIYDSPYYHKSPEEIKQMWADKRDESARCSRKLREDIMTILSHKQCERDETTKLFDTFNKEWKISPYRTNWPIYDRESGIIATVDCLSNKDGKFILYSWVRTDSALEEVKFGLRNHMNRFVVDSDYKRTIVRSYYDNGIAGKSFAKLRDCKFTKYSIEQYVIMYILRKNYGIKVDECYIVIMHPTYDIPIALYPDNVSKEVVDFMAREAKNNTSKPTPKNDFGKHETPVFSKNDVESIDLMELF